MLQPRLTGSLRAFSQVSQDGPDNFDINQLRKYLRKKTCSRLSWDDLTESFKKDRKLESMLQKIKAVAKEALGSDQPPDVIEEAAATLFFEFYKKKNVGPGLLAKLKVTFSLLTSSIAHNLLKDVNYLAEHLPPSMLEKLETTNEDGGGAKVQDWSFGANIKVHTPKLKEDLVLENRLVDFCGTLTNEKEFSMAFDGGVKQIPEVKYGRDWLSKKLNGFADDTKDLADSVVSMLSSERSDESLQNELFDLLGFERFELISDLLQNRSAIVSKTGEELKRKANNGIVVSMQQKSKTGLRAPSQISAIASNVSVMSGAEKQYQKQIRKEEKKLQKLAKAVDDDDDVYSEASERLVKAQREPLFARKAVQREKFPFVFDALADVTSTLVGGSRLLLPENAKRNNHKTYEEVNIPATATKPSGVSLERLPIKSLDQVGQMAFAGCKSLNIIQSIVFSQAYETNENLLVCAPTGAGKTNIAMLTVVHQIKQHIVSGVIQKDKFKIVYVAPMKALAAEMARNFSQRLEPLGISVRELTGDMQLTKSEIAKTQMLVTTPEKWDVVTRKSSSDIALTQIVKLLIIDEVHLLHGDRGPVVEALVARTLRQVEASQNMIRIVGLSATLPNYIDVARFLRVNPYIGLFYFDGRFRPVPLETTFVGIKAVNPLQMLRDMDDVCYNKVVDMVNKKHQVMVFVHARNATLRTAETLREIAKQKNQLQAFRAANDPKFGNAVKTLSKSRNKKLGEIFQDGFGIHHAGMLRSDRTMVENLFRDGLIRVLVCTATLAWGVNLPAHAVVIKGTEIYDSKKGSFVDLGILDVLQIFGRAGRPQYDTSGHGMILTSHEKLSHYLSLITHQYPIESNFIVNMTDNLNAEISLGTVSNVSEAVEWLSYTYLFVRMRKNPLGYGIKYEDAADDPMLSNFRRELVFHAARRLDHARMIRFDEVTETLNSTDLGRVASDFYVKYDTVEVFNGMIKPVMNEAEILQMMSNAQEFEQLKVRDDEMDELDNHITCDCQVPVKGGSENVHGKVNILMQTYLSKGRIDSFSLVSDQMYILQNCPRIARALFEIVLRKGWPLLTARLLKVALMFERQMWDFENPLRQFTTLGHDLLEKIEDKKLTIDRVREMDSKELGILIRDQKNAPTVKRYAHEFPKVELDATIQPITRTVIRVMLIVSPDFRWNDRIHGNTSEAFWIWVEDPETNHMYHHEYFILTKKQVVTQESQTVVFTIPIFEPLPSQYYIKAINDRWLGSECIFPLSFQHLILPERHPPHTNLLDLKPLPVQALDNPIYEMLYPFTHFNPIQTQLFHTLYHTDGNVLLGAPTGSGKTIVAEIAIFRVFNEYPGSKVVYIAPLKALVRERIEDWKVRLEKKLSKKVVELTGDVTPDARAIASADVIVTTPEKWDGVSRSWQTRDFVKKVALIIIDEIHLLGEDRGPVLEVIVSRTNFIAAHTGRTLRIIGLSTAIANARDLADWLNIRQVGLYNFRPSVRPVPLEVHIAGFPGKHYCPRMATMNRPAFLAIKQHSPDKPVLIFVSSRRQTRLTALDLIGCLAGEENPRQWLHMQESEMEAVTAGLKDPNLKLTCSFGIGMHHAGLTDKDRRTIEELFVNQKIQILIATSTLAWGVNFPAHLVIIKGTEYYDGKTKRYIDMPITDVLQMMGRAGRPQYDNQGVAVVFVHDIKKHFYKKFLYEPFPVESSLLKVLPEHLNAEVVAGTISSKQDCLDYMTWTYMFRRLLQNPTYYGLDDVNPENVNKFLSGIVEKALLVLETSSCIFIGEDNRTIETTVLGRIASYYYLSHLTVQLFNDKLSSNSSLLDLLKILSDVQEYAELPVRHNEDNQNAELAKLCPVEVNQYTFDSPHTKAHLLFQAHFSRLPLPISDYHTDTKSVLDQAIRILQAMLDVAADRGWLVSALRIQQLVQMVIQGRWIHDPSVLILPHLDRLHIPALKRICNTSHIPSLPELIVSVDGKMDKLSKELSDDLGPAKLEEVFDALVSLPLLRLEVTLDGIVPDTSCISNRPVKFSPSSLLDSDWLQVVCNQEYTVNINISRLPTNYKKRSDRRHAFAPKFPKPKEEGWYFVLGSVEEKELWALKRSGPLRWAKSAQQLSFAVPSNPGRFVVVLFMLSDSYLGLDQQYSLHLEAVKVKDNMGPYTRSTYVSPFSPAQRSNRAKKSSEKEVSETCKGWMEEDGHPSWE
ncbi:activating signal cointegrator 1 complex subunit 3-like [Artemia franciscana]|uniref:activating signal cointegrator 1 complex subunit 3-like n=1 Tax=Artemia franciscana TaxID=6661 RepID=UPI0032DA1148